MLKGKSIGLQAAQAVVAGIGLAHSLESGGHVYVDTRYGVKPMSWEPMDGSDGSYCLSTGDTRLIGSRSTMQELAELIRRVGGPDARVTPLDDGDGPGWQVVI